MINTHSIKKAIGLKSLLVIVVLQFIVLQAQAMSMASLLYQKNCHHSESNADYSHSHSKEHALSACAHCEEANLDCDNSCDISSLVSLVDKRVGNLDGSTHPLYFNWLNTNHIAALVLPNLRPPR